MPRPPQHTPSQCLEGTLRREHAPPPPRPLCGLCGAVATHPTATTQPTTDTHPPPAPSRPSPPRRRSEPVLSALVNTVFYGKPPSMAKACMLLPIVGGVAFASLKKGEIGRAHV